MFAKIDGNLFPVSIRRSLGFSEKYRISEEMAIICGTNIASRVDVTKALCKYIKDNNLNNPKDRREIIPNEEFATLLGYNTNTDEKLTYYTLQKYVQKHYIRSYESHEISGEFATLIFSIFSGIPMHLFTCFERLENNGFIKDGELTCKGNELLRIMSCSISDCSLILYCNSDCDMFKKRDGFRRRFRRPKKYTTVKQLITVLEENERAYEVCCEEIIRCVNMDIVSIVLEYIFYEVK